MAFEITEEMIARQPPEAQAIIRLLLARLRELEGRLPKTPQNSSLPPSTQHPHAKPAPPKPRSRRQRGGQPGHPKHSRTLLPTVKCDKVLSLKPTACRRCGQALTGHDPEPWRHQVCELPEIKLHVTEYQRHRLTCSDCGTTTCAPLPVGVPTCQAGPHLIAFTALLMGCFRQSKRRVALFLETFLHQPCSPGWVVKLQQHTTAALQPACLELAQQLPTQPRLGIDESPTKEGRSKAWLWTFVAATFTVFAQRTTRAATVLTELLTDSFTGVIHCDRAKMYGTLARARLQWCWAHLIRDFQALIDHTDPQVRRLGHDLMRATRAVFRLRTQARAGPLTRRQFRRRMQPLRKEVEALLLRGVFSGNPRLAGMCQELHKHRTRLWTFVDIDGVEPTNNASERALRPAVIWRKLSFGTQCASGSRFVETMLTVIETCRQQSRNAFTFVTAAVQAHLAHQPSPSLLDGV